MTKKAADIGAVEQEWKGNKSYKCAECSFAHMEKTIVLQHYARKHAEAAEKKHAAAAEKTLADLTVPELEARAESAGVDREAIAGSGKDGAVLKNDLIGAIEAAGSSES